MALESHAAIQNRRGLATEAGYDSYFALRPSGDSIPKSTIDHIFEDLSDEARLTASFDSYLHKNNGGGRPVIGLLEDLLLRFAVKSPPTPTQALLDTLFAIGEEIFRIPWSGGLIRLEPSSSWRFLVIEILEKWGKADAGRHLLAAFKRCESSFVLAEIYVDRGRELSTFPAELIMRPAISKEDFDKLGESCGRKYLAVWRTARYLVLLFIGTWRELGVTLKVPQW